MLLKDKSADSYLKCIFILVKYPYDNNNNSNDNSSSSSIGSRPSIVTSRRNHHITTNNIFPAQQKGNSSSITFGTIDQLRYSFNKMIQEDANKRKKNLPIAWIDYKTAFPHDWIVGTL